MHCKYSKEIQKYATNIHSANKYRNVLQILRTQPNTEMRCKYSQCNQIKKHTVNSQQNLQKCAANTHNVTKYRNMMQILTTLPNTEKHCTYSQIKDSVCHVFLHLVALWVFSAHVLLNWWYFHNLLVFFLFMCVSLSCSTLSSLGQHKIASQWIPEYVKYKYTITYTWSWAAFQTPSLHRSL